MVATQRDMYVILEGSIELGIYEIDAATGIPTFINTTCPLIPKGKPSLTIYLSPMNLLLTCTAVYQALNPIYGFIQPSLLVRRSGPRTQRRLPVGNTPGLLS